MSWLCGVSGEKQAATNVSLDQEYDQEQAVMWCQLEEQVVASAHRGVVPAAFQPSQCCLNSQTDNLRTPLAVVEGTESRWLVALLEMYVLIDWEKCIS
jgi:hypothetical protein